MLYRNRRKRQDRRRHQEKKSQIVKEDPPVHVVSETTLKNYNSLLKDHVKEVVKNHSTMKYQEGLTNMEFHGGSTLVSVLIVVFIIIGLYLAYHFLWKHGCLKRFDSNNDPDWQRHAERHARLAMMRLEQREMDTLSGPAEMPRTHGSARRDREFS